MKKATVITVYDNDGKEIKNVSTEIVLNGETYVKMGTGKPLPPNPATKPIWETCRELMWRYDSNIRIVTNYSIGSMNQDVSLYRLNKHLNALAYLSEVARRCNGGRVVEWEDYEQMKYFVDRERNELQINWSTKFYTQIAFLDKAARDHSLEVDRHIWNDYYGLPNE
jgi:hypothetical protein